MDSHSYTVDLLNEIAELLQDHSDVVDGSYGEPRPNRAMSLLTRVEEEIERLKKPAWRLVESDELPEGPPVAPGRTIYCFYRAPVGHHWEYELPDVPFATSQPASGGSRGPECA